MDGNALGGLGIGLGSAISQQINAEKNRDAQAAQNQRNIQQQEKMYRWQRDDARADWEAQNAYNSPLQQMERLRQAGLSPHLVYGKGADVTAQAVKSYSGDAPNQDAPKREMVDMASQLLTGMDTAFKQVQTDNVREDTLLKQKEGNVKDATVASMLQNTAVSQFELEQAQRAKDVVYENLLLGNDKMSAEIDKIQADTYFTLESNQRQKLANSANIAKTVQEIAESRIRILNEKAQTVKNYAEKNKILAEAANLKQTYLILGSEKIIKQAEANLRSRGINPNDPNYMRMLSETIDAIKKGLKIYEYKDK